MDLIALVGSETPLGRDVRELLTDKGFGNALRLIGATDEDASILTAHRGEATFLSPLDENELRDADVIVSATDAASTMKTWQMIKAAPQPFIDLSGALESHPGARIRCPILPEEATAPGNPLVVAHPAAAALAILLTRVQSSFPIRHSVAQVFEPASERGLAGINELQEQVSGLLSFRAYPKRIFDAQAAFNMLPRYGEDAPESLANAEARMERHLATLLAGRAPMPSLRLIQAPVFHGHSIGIWVEFESRPSATKLGQAIASVQVDVRGADLDPATNVGVAGQTGITVGPIQEDHSHPAALWLWAAADNYRLSAENAVALVRSILQGDSQ
jgi:aspartate-semialdehyde dehydrogenase